MKTLAKMIILSVLLTLCMPAMAKPNELMNYFSGNWVMYTKNGQKNVTLRSNGEYIDYSESNYSGGNYDQYGNQTQAWGVSGQNSSHMTWSVRGTKTQGVFIFTYDDGSQDESEYHVHVEKGKTYWNEYIVDGQLYSRR